MSKSLASGRQASSSSGWRHTRSVRVWTRIQRFRTPRRRQRLRELEAALRVVPEEVVRDEDVSPDRREVVDDGADRALAEGAAVELPDRAEVAAEGAAARRLDEPNRLEEEAVVAVAVALDEVARRQRHAVEARALGERRASTIQASPVSQAQRRARRRAAGLARARRRRPARRLLRRPRRSRRSRALSSGAGVRRGGVSADEDERLRETAAHRRARSRGRGRTRERACRRSRRRAGGSAGPASRTPWPKRRSTIAGSCPRARSAAATYSSPSGSTRKNGPEPESLVAGIRAQQQDIHGLSRRIVDSPPEWEKDARRRVPEGPRPQRARAEVGRATACRTGSSTEASTTARAGCRWRC